MPKIVNTSGINGASTDFSSVNAVSLINDLGETIVGSNDFIPVGVASGSASIPVSQSGNFYVEQSGTWTVQQGNAPWTVDAIQSGTWAVQSSQPSGESYRVDFASNAYDAFGRFRISEAISIFDSKQSVTNDGTIWDRISLSGSQVHSAGMAETAMTVSASGGYAVCQTFQRMNYQPGKGQLVFETAYRFEPETDVVKRVGYFTATTTAPYYSGTDGLWFESSNGVISVNCRNNSNGVLETATQANWNIDKMNGSGVSALNIDWSKNQIYVIQFQWLGVGRVVFGLDVAGTIYPVHYFDHANETSGVYMSSPNKPIRYDIYSTGATSGTLYQVCSSVQSEGGINPRFLERGIDNGLVGVTGPAKDLEWGVLGLRLSPTVLNADGINIGIETVEIATSTTNAVGGWRLKLNPTVAGALTWLPLPQTSGIEYAVGGATNLITSGTNIHGGFYTTSTSNSVGTLNSLSRIGVGISGNSNTLFLTSFNNVNNCNIYGNIDFQVIY